MSNTKNLGLKLPNMSDFFSLGDFNANFERIDANSVDTIKEAVSSLANTGKWYRRKWRTGYSEFFYIVDRTASSAGWNDMGDGWGYMNVNLSALPAGISPKLINASISLEKEYTETPSPIIVNVYETDPEDNKIHLALMTPKTSVPFRGYIMVHAICTDIYAVADPPVGK